MKLGLGEESKTQMDIVRGGGVHVGGRVGRVGRGESDLVSKDASSRNYISIFLRINNPSAQPSQTIKCQMEILVTKKIKIKMALFQSMRLDIRNNHSLDKVRFSSMFSLYLGLQGCKAGRDTNYIHSWTSLGFKSFRACVGSCGEHMGVSPRKGTHPFLDYKTIATNDKESTIF